MPLLEIKNLTKYYSRSGSYFKVLDNLDLCVNEGDFCQIVGRSGSGKSTLLNIISNLIEIDGGELIFDGKQIKSFTDITTSDREDVDEMIKREKNHVYSLPENIAYMPQGIKLLPNLTVWQNIRLAYDLYAQKKQIFIKEADFVSYAEELIVRSKIMDILDSYPASLSGGENKRVQLVRSLLLKPRLLLCDEPLSDLDAVSRQEIMELLFECNKFTTIIMVTHDLDYVNKTICYTMTEGRLERGICLL